LLKTLIDKNEYIVDGYYNKEYDNYLNGVKDDFLNKHNTYESLSKVTAHAARNVKYLSNKDMTKVERRIVKVLEGYGCWQGREFRIGVSSGYAAWTDGITHITLDREWLKGLSLAWDGDIAHLFGVLAHELAHDTDTSLTDIHGEDFYQNYHDITKRRGSVNPFTYTMQFRESMKNAMRAEQRAAEKKREQAELKAKAKKLGLAASTK